MGYTLSYTGLKLFQECPRCFWLHYVKGIKRPKMPFPSLPSGMDRVLKNYFDLHRKQGTLPPELQALQGVQLFPDQEKVDKWRNPFGGLVWHDGLGNKLIGAVDEVLQQDEKLIVLDFKTCGRQPNTATARYYQDQMAVYCFLLSKNGFAISDSAYLLFYYPSSMQTQGNFSFQYMLVNMKVELSRTEALFNAAIELLHGPSPSPSGKCSYCINSVCN